MWHERSHSHHAQADGRLIGPQLRARQVSTDDAGSEFQRWLADYAAADERVSDAMDLIDRMAGYVSTGGHHFTRDE
jgi:truncated hemoglobin YjbI